MNISKTNTGARGRRSRTTSGFTLIEMIIAIGVFSIMSVAIAGAFTSGFSSYSDTRELQRNIETAQYALNTLEKLLRTSTVISAGGANAQTVTFYDYSSARCFRYDISGGPNSNLFARWFATTDPFGAVPCTTGSANFSTSAQVTSGYVTGGFTVVPSDKDDVTVDGDPKAMGRVTVNLSVKADSAAAIASRIQATSSLRDYSNVGF